MTIKEATERALKEGKWITRKGIQLRAMIKPTNTKDCCLVKRQGTLDPPHKYWNPTAEDLAADDWILIEEGSNMQEVKEEKEVKELKIYVEYDVEKALEKIQKVKAATKELEEAICDFKYYCKAPQITDGNSNN